MAPPRPVNADIGKQPLVQVAHTLQRPALRDALTQPHPQLREEAGAAAGDDLVTLVDGM